MLHLSIEFQYIYICLYQIEVKYYKYTYWFFFLSWLIYRNSVDRWSSDKMIQNFPIRTPAYIQRGFVPSRRNNFRYRKWNVSVIWINREFLEKLWRYRHYQSIFLASIDICVWFDLSANMCYVCTHTQVCFFFFFFFGKNNLKKFLK